MNLIDEELESFEEKDIEVLVTLLDDAIGQRINQINKIKTVSLESLAKDDPEFAKITDLVKQINPEMVEEATRRVIGKYVEQARVELLEMQQVITKLHLLKSRI